MQGKKTHVGVYLCVQLGQVFGWLSHFTRFTQSGFCVGAKLVAQRTKTKLSHLLFVTVGM